MTLVLTGGTYARLAADLGSFVGLGDPQSSQGSSGPSTPPGPLSPLPSSPFKLPPAYQESKERKVHAVTELRQHIKSVSCLSFHILHPSTATRPKVPVHGFTHSTSF